MAEDLADIEGRVESLESRMKMAMENHAWLTKTVLTNDKKTSDDVAELKKQVGDPKEIADLKARVKELEAKLAKMKK
jgi:BMFP domain-containing protein YqiC